MRLAVLLDAHLLDEEIHDDERDQREKKGVVLDGVDLEDDERLVEERRVQVLVQSDLVVAAFVEILHQVVVGSKVDPGEVVLLADLGNTLDTELIESIEVERLYPSSEMVLIVFCYGLFDELVLGFRHRSLRSLPDKHHKVLQESHLLDVVFRARDAERVHGDRMFLGIADILASDVLAQSFIGVSGIDHHDIRVLLPHLADD